MEITIRLRNTSTGQEEDIAFPTTIEKIRARFGQEEHSDDDSLVIIDSNVGFIGEDDLLRDVCEFAELAADADEHVVYACREFFGYSVRDFIFYIDSFDDIALLYDVDSDRELGEYLIDELGFQSLSREQLEMYFDYEAFGRDVAIENAGGYVSDGFLDVR